MNNNNIIDVVIQATTTAVIEFLQLELNSKDLKALSLIVNKEVKANKEVVKLSKEKPKKEQETKVYDYNVLDIKNKVNKPLTIKNIENIFSYAYLVGKYKDLKRAKREVEHDGVKLSYNQVIKFLKDGKKIRHNGKIYSMIKGVKK